MMKIIRTIIFCTAAVSFSSALQAKSYPVSSLYEPLRSYHLLVETNQAFGSKPAVKLAKVHFLVDASDTLGFDYSEPQFDLKNAAKCKELGFATEASVCASSGQNPAQLCPYDTSYTNACCDPAFKFTKAECSYPQTISSNSCNNKYKCYCDTTLYPYTESNCAAPYVLSDKCIDDGGAHYAECSCPASWLTCDAEIKQMGVGSVCRESGEEDKYASCQCQSGYTQTCDDYGPKSPADYCFWKGTKYFKSCKTALEACEGLGFSHSADNPCSADEVPDSYCPKNGSYFSCRIDPDKYCKNRGFTTGACGTYQQSSSEKCPYDTADIYHKCTHTCKSRIYEETGGKINFDGGLSYAGAPMVYLNSLTDNNFGTSAKIYRGPHSYNYEECLKLSRPTVSTSNNAETLIDGLTLSDFNLNLTTRNFNDFVVKQKITLTRMKISAPYSNDQLDIRPLGATIEINNKSCYLASCDPQTSFYNIDHIALRDNAVLHINDAVLNAPKMYIYVGSGSTFKMVGNSNNVSVIGSLRGENGYINISDKQTLQVFGKLLYNEFKYLGLDADCGASIVMDAANINLTGLLTTDGASYSFNSHYVIDGNQGRFCAYDHCFNQNGKVTAVGITIKGRVYSFREKRYHYNYLSSNKCSIYPKYNDKWLCLDLMELDWSGRYPSGNCYTYNSISQSAYGRDCNIPDYQ